MSQFLIKEQADQLYPKKSNKIFFLSHSYNGVDSIGKCLESIKPLNCKSLVLIDTRSNDGTKEVAQNFGAVTPDLVWEHSFSYAKNECLRQAMIHLGLEYGDWVFFMGDDMELLPHCAKEILEFVKDDYNFFAQFNVREFDPDPNKTVVERKRKLIWRHNPLIYWENWIHEEAYYSAARVTRMGIPHGGVEWKIYPTLGGNGGSIAQSGMLHYGYHNEGGEFSLEHRRKQAYYNILTQLSKVRVACNFSDNKTGMLQSLSFVLNEEQTDLDKSINNLLDRFMSGDIAPGLAHLMPYNLVTNVNDADDF